MQGVLGINERFPDARFYIFESMPLESVLIIYSHILEHHRLKVKEVWLFKKSGAVAHEFIVFAVYDTQANDPTKPLSYIRIDRRGVISKDQAPTSTSKATGTRSISVLSTGDPTTVTVAPAPAVGSRDDVDASVATPFVFPSTQNSSRLERLSPSSSFYLSESSSSLSAYRTGDDRFCMNESLTALLHKREESDVEKYELAVQFDQRTDPMRLLVLASTIRDVAPEYRVHSQNCYFFSKMVVELAVEVLGGTAVKTAKSNAGKAAHLWPLPFLSDTEFKKLYEGAKLRYKEKWSEFEQEVSCPLQNA